MKKPKETEVFFRARGHLPTISSFSKKKVEIPFDSAFQDDLVRTLAKDFKFAIAVQGRLDPTSLDSRTNRWIATKVFSHVERYKRLPDPEVLAREVKKATRMGLLAGSDAVSTAQAVKRLSKPVRQAEWVKDNVYDFLKEKAFYGAMKEAKDLIRERKFDTLDQLLLKTAGYQPHLDSSLGGTVAEGIDHRIRKRKVQQDFGIPSGLPVDRVMKSEGLQRGQLGTLVAPPGRGKTAGLVHVGASAAEDGENVLHLSLEMAKDDIDDMYDARFVKIDRNSLRKKPKSIRKRYNKIAKTRANRVWSKDYPPNVLTPEEIRTLLDRLRDEESFVPALLIVDYADLMGSSSASFRADDDYRVQGETYRKLRQIAAEYNVAIWTASQSNRGGLDKEVLNLQDLADSFQKAMVADVVCLLCQTADEEKNGHMRIMIGKNRNGYRGMEFVVKMNTARCFVRELPEATKAWAQRQATNNKKPTKIGTVSNPQKASINPQPRAPVSRRRAAKKTTS